VVCTAVLGQTFATKADSPAQALAIAFTVVMLSGVFQIPLPRLPPWALHHPEPYHGDLGLMSGIGPILIGCRFGPARSAQPTGGVSAPWQSLPQLLQGVNRGIACWPLDHPRQFFWWTPGADQTAVSPPRCSPCFLARPSPWWPSRGVGAAPDRWFDSPSGLPQLHPAGPHFPLLAHVLINCPPAGDAGSIGLACSPVWFPTASPASEHEVRQRELVGQGLRLHSWPAFCGALPGSGATHPATVGPTSKAGGRTALSGILRALHPRPDACRAFQPGSRIPLAVAGGDRLQKKGGVGIGHSSDWGFLRRWPQLLAQGALILSGGGAHRVVDLIGGRWAVAFSGQ